MATVMRERAQPLLQLLLPDNFRAFAEIFTAALLQVSTPRSSCGRAVMCRHRRCLHFSAAVNPSSCV